MNKRKKALIEWMEELVLNENRNERELWSVWNNLRGLLMKEDEEE